MQGESIPYREIPIPIARQTRTRHVPDFDRLVITAEGSGPLLLDFVSLFPEENGVAGSKTPFRQDILALLKDLKPG